MEFIGQFANMNNFAAIVLLVVIAVLAIGIWKGKISFKGKGLSVGTADSEAKIRSMQQVYAKALFNGAINDLPKECEYYHKRFVIGECLDEVERMIRENHITSDGCYIDTEFQIIYNIVLKYTTLDYFRSNEFKCYLMELIKKLVEQLEKIRKQYS